MSSVLSAFGISYFKYLPVYPRQAGPARPGGGRRGGGRAAEAPAGAGAARPPQGCRRAYRRMVPVRTPYQLVVGFHAQG